MSANSIGYRFDTLYKNFSNSGLMWGKSDVDADKYKDYIDELDSKTNKFMVATPKDFNRKITVTKIKNWINQYSLDLVAIDGIKYMSDERGRKGDTLTTTLTNISEDLMVLSNELEVPIIVVAQANRAGAVDDDADGPSLESVRDSDGIAQNASKVLAIRQRKDNVLEISVKKQRFGPVGGTLLYNWDINLGDFAYIPSSEYAQPRHKTDRAIQAERKKFNDKEDVF